MARRKLVTRTIVATVVTCLCMDVKTAEPVNATYRVVGKFTDDEKLLKEIRKNNETDEFKIVAVVDKEVSEQLYGLDENIFIAEAHVIEKR